MDTQAISVSGWCILLVCGVLIGMSKTGLPGLGILVVAVMAAVLPPKASTGMLLPLLIVADVIAVSLYRRHAVWSHLLPLLPWALGGIVVGALLLGRLADAQLGPLIGGIVLVMLLLNRLRQHLGLAEAPPSGRWLAPLLGFVAGATTMLANAAGPIMILYLLMMRLPKVAFVGTAAWFFLIVNCIKVPFSAHLDLITADSLRLNLVMAPMILAGTALGAWGLKRIPQNWFNGMVEVLAAAAGLALMLR